MLNLLPIIVAQQIKPQTVCLWINDLFQLVLYIPEQSRIQYTLKNRILNPLSIVYTNFCNLPQPPLPYRCCGTNVICDQHHHVSHLLP